MEKNIVLKICNVSKTYKKQKVLNSISMEFEKGKIYGIIGPNGVGKTTLIRIIAGMSSLDSGEIFFNDNANELCLNQLKKNIGCIIEKPYLDESLTAMDNMRISGYLNKITDKEVLRKTLELVGLTNDKKKVKNYSLGMKQRLGIACLLLKKPSMLFLDEPMNGMDPEGVMTLRNMLINMAHEQGKTIVVTSHMLSEMRKLCDAYYFINNGEIIKYIEDVGLEIDLEELYMNLILKEKPE